MLVVLSSLLIDPVQVVEDVGEDSRGVGLPTAQAPADDSSQHEVVCSVMLSVQLRSSQTTSQLLPSSGFSLQTNGPPLSPLQASTPPSSLPAHIISGMMGWLELE